MVNADQRAADAAFFQDWAEWESLDNLPRPPQTGDGRRILYGPAAITGPQHRYYCILRNHSPLGGPGFELCLPQYQPAIALLQRVKGAVPHPLTRHSHCRHRNALRNVWCVPAANWRQLWAVLPALKLLVAARCNQIEARP